MSVLSGGECRDGGRHAAGADAKYAATHRSENDHIVATPATTEPAVRISHHNGWSAGDRDLLQLASCEECDEPTVLRPEWKRGALGSLYRPRFRAGHRSQPDFERGLRPGHERDVSTIRR